MAAYGLKGSGSFTALHRPLSCKAGLGAEVRVRQLGLKVQLEPRCLDGSSTALQHSPGFEADTSGRIRSHPGQASGTWGLGLASPAG